MLKSKFIQYLEGKDFATKTIQKHTKNVEQFLKKVKKEDIRITKPDVLKFLEWLKKSLNKENSYRYDFLTSLNHYFSFLYDAGTITENPCWFLKIRGTFRKKLYKIYTPEELDQLFDNWWQVFVKNYDDVHILSHQREQAALIRERRTLMLSFLINQGITTTEIKNLELGDLNLHKAVTNIRAEKRLNDRILPLKAQQMGHIIHYLQNVRPKFTELKTAENNKLFLSLPAVNKKETENQILHNAFILLSKQLKSIDKQFINVVQLRTSVITTWVKTESLRKAQYMAGHRYVSTTENYLQNNLDGLIDDINKMHPF
jgi:integrase/recombinase XerD